MKSHKIALLSAISLLLISLPMVSMDTPGMIKAAGKVARWAKKLGNMLTGEEPIGNMQAQLVIPNDPLPFEKLPNDVKREIILTASMYNATQSLKEAARMISNLAQVNKSLNELINDRNFCLRLIKSLAKRFDCSDFGVSDVLKTKGAKEQHALQQELFDLCLNKKKLVDDSLLINLVQLITKGVDLNYTYYPEKSPALVIATYVTPALAFYMLDAPGIDPELADKYGVTALAAAEENPEQNAKLIEQLKKAMKKK